MIEITPVSYHDSFVGAKGQNKDRLEDFDEGGVELSDSSEGLLSYVWHCVAEENRIYIKREDRETYDLIHTTQSNITDVSFTFDGSGKLQVAFMEEDFKGKLFLKWHNPLSSQDEIREFNTPALDILSVKIFWADKRTQFLADTTSYLVYVGKVKATGQKNIYYRSFLDRFDVEYVIEHDIVATQILRFGMLSNWRLGIELNQRSQKEDRYFWNRILRLDSLGKTIMTDDSIVGKENVLSGQVGGEKGITKTLLEDYAQGFSEISELTIYGQVEDLGLSTKTYVWYAKATGKTVKIKRVDVGIEYTLYTASKEIEEISIAIDIRGYVQLVYKELETKVSYVVHRDISGVHKKDSLGVVFSPKLYHKQLDSYSFLVFLRATGSGFSLVVLQYSGLRFKNVGHQPEVIISNIKEGKILAFGSPTSGNKQNMIVELQGYTAPLSNSWQTGSIIEDLTEQSGLEQKEIKIRRVTDRSLGLLIPQKKPLSILQELGLTHFFDISSHGGRIHFVGRGGGEVVDIPLEDLIPIKDTLLEEKRNETIEIPMQLNLEYYDIEGGLGTDLQTSTLAKDTRVFGEENIEVPEILNANTAKTIAVKHHKLMIEEQRGEVKFTLPKKYIYLTTTDVVTIDGKRLRIEKVEVDLLTQTYTCKYDRQSIYKTEAEGIPVEPPTPPAPEIFGEPALEILDVNILKDSDDMLGVYVAVQRSQSGWYGVELSTSIDNGQSWEMVDIIRNEAVMGVLQEDLAYKNQHFIDNTNKIVIKLYDDRDELNDYSLRANLNRRGYVWIDGEVIAYQQADYTEEGFYELSELMRGRRGTQPKEHQSGVNVVMLDIGAVTFYPMPLSMLNRTFLIRATALGTTDTHTIQEITYRGESQRELAPAMFKAKIKDGKTYLSWNSIGKLGGSNYTAFGNYFLGYNIYINEDEPIFLQGDIRNNIIDDEVSGTIRICAVNGLTKDGYESEVEI